MSVRFSLFLTLLLSVIAIFWHLGQRGITEPDEGRYAGIAREMYSSGDWMTPRIYGMAHFDKPPLIYWSSVMAYHIGGVNECMARLPAALCALGTLLLTWGMARRLWTPTAAFYSAVILLTCPLFFTLSRIIDPNMMLTFWVTLALWSALVWQIEGKQWQRWIFYLALGLSSMTKGPVGIAVVALTLIGLRYGGSHERPWRPMWSWAEALLCVAMGLWWFIAVAMADHELWNFFLKRELYNRYFTEQHQRQEPFYFYPIMFVIGSIPWLPLLVSAVRSSWRTFRSAFAFRLLASWIVLPTIMFSLADSKMPTYILPLFPALALLAGSYLDGALQGKSLSWRLPLWLCLVAVALWAGLLFWGVHHHNWSLFYTTADIWWLAAAALCLALLLKPASWSRFLAPSLLLLVVFLHTDALVTRNERLLDSHTPTREMATALKQVLQPADRIVLLDRHPRSLSFYIEQPITVPRYKFPFQIASDETHMAGHFFDEAAQVYVWYESTQHVYLVTSDKALSNMMTVVRRPYREIYRDSRYVLVSNE